MTPSVEQIMECIENPTKVKILMLLQEQCEATAKELLAACPGIPQATLYRYLKSMIATGIIEITRETRVRAVTEKTYAIATQFWSMESEIVQNNNGEAYYRLFSGFVLGLLKKFELYSKTKSLDIAADGSSFNAVPVYATAGQLAECSRQIEKILQPLMTKTYADQKPHTMAIIVTPPNEQEP